MIRVQVLAASTWLAAVNLIRTAVWEATIALVCTVALVPTVHLRTPITLRATVTLITTVVACSFETAILTRRSIVPGQAKGIFTDTALGVFDPDYSGAAISRLEREVLMTASVDRRELKVCRICRHCRRTFEPAPTWSCTTEVPQHAIRAQNVDLDISINGDHNSALANIRISASNDSGALRKGLGAGKTDY
jgi:hypothetical protein